jgi:hypothetical protein
MQLMTEDKALQFQSRPALESAGKERDDRMYLSTLPIPRHAGPKTLDFSMRSVFLEATGGATCTEHG